MPDSEPKVIHLKDYLPSEFLIDSVFLYFDLHEMSRMSKRCWISKEISSYNMMPRP